MSNSRRATGADVDPRGLTRLQIGGRKRTLRFDSNAIIEAQEATGCEGLEAALMRAGSLDVRIIRALLWAGLLHQDEDLEIREVGSWLGDGPGCVSLMDALVPLIAAVNAAIGVDPEETAKALKGADPRAVAARPTKGGRGTGTPPSEEPSEQD